MSKQEKEINTFDQLAEEEKQDLFTERENCNVSTDSASKTTAKPKASAICVISEEEILNQFKTALTALLPALKTRKKAEYAENMAKLIELLTKIYQYSMHWCRSNRANLEEFVSAIELQDVTRKEIYAKIEEYIQSMTNELERMHDAEVKKRIEALLKSPLLTREYKKAIFEIAEKADLAIDVKEV